MDNEPEFCDICKHSRKSHRFGHCVELKSVSEPELNPAVFSEGCSCPGFLATK